MKKCTPNKRKAIKRGLGVVLDQNEEVDALKKIAHENENKINALKNDNNRLKNDIKNRDQTIATQKEEISKWAGIYQKKQEQALIEQEFFYNNYLQSTNPPT